MEPITDRQREILMAIIKEFMVNADEVGSLSLLEKYDSRSSNNECCRMDSVYR